MEESVKDEEHLQVVSTATATLWDLGKLANLAIRQPTINPDKLTAHIEK